MPQNPSYASGQEILEGRLYRRILPFRTHYADGKATQEVFRWRADREPVGQISGALADHVSDLNDYATNHPAPNAIRDRFGVCELDIRSARERAGVQVYYQPSDGPNGSAHVVIKHCQYDEVMITLASLAQTVLAPKIP